LALDSTQEQVVVKIKNEWIEKFKQTHPTKNTFEEIVGIINTDKIDEGKFNKISEEMIKNRTDMFLFINVKFKELHSILILLLAIFTTLGLYYERNTNLSDEYYNLYSIIIGEDIAFLVFI
jgi:hypothetical protein